jgi:small subunit ribosomal protein S4
VAESSTKTKAKGIRRRKQVKRSRALNTPLTPKSVKYFEKRPYRPGLHGRRRRTASDYSLRLHQKQLLREQYNMSEKQLKRAFDEAVRMDGKTGDNLIAVLESRLDATVLRAGFARTIYQARQMASHKHFTVNGTRVNIPSYRLQPGDVVEVHEKSRSKDPLVLASQGAYAGEGPSVPYLDVQRESVRLVVLRAPARDEVPVICNDQLVVEYYSR